MRQIAGIVVVALVSIFNMYVGVPAGYGFDLGPTVIGVAAFVGSVGGTVALVFLGDRVMPLVASARDRVMGVVRMVRPTEEGTTGGGETSGGEAPGEEEQRPSGRLRAISDRFGVVGIGLIGPLAIGGFATAVSGLALGYPRGRLAVWVGVGQGLVVLGYLVLVDTVVA